MASELSGMAKQQNERDTTLDSWSHNPPDRAAHKRGENKANKTKNNCGKFSKLNYLFFLKTFPVFITSQAVYNVQTKILFLSRVLVSSCAKTSHLAHERSEERSLTNTINKSEPEVIQLFAISMLRLDDQVWRLNEGKFAIYRARRLTF